jgi:hypothetical protein
VDPNDGGFLDLVVTSLNQAPRSPRVHFGLGAETSAATIEIQWPSGATQTLRNVAADQILRLEEPH